MRDRILQINPYAEVITYLARDVESGENVLVKEFFSESVMERNENGEISVKQGREVLYKSLMSDYEELCRYAMELPESVAVIGNSAFAGCTSLVKVILNKVGEFLDKKKEKSVDTI